MSLSLGALLALGAISGLSGLASSGIQFAGQKALQEDAQDYNSLEAQLARDFTSTENTLARNFSLEYDSTKYQRSVSDLKAAGLNPAMVLGTTSSTAPLSGSSIGSQASSGVANFYSSGFSNIVSSAINAGLTQSLKNENFRKTMLSNTGRQLASISNNIEINSSNYQLSQHEQDLLNGFISNLR